jgi:hypothetical protein
MPRIFQKITTSDRVINQIQDNIGLVVNPVAAIPLNSGNLLQQVSLLSGSNSVNHKLGRALIGWFLVRQRAAASVYDTQDTNPTPTLTLNIVASTDCVVDIYVF